MFAFALRPLAAFALRPLAAFALRPLAAFALTLLAVVAAVVAAGPGPVSAQEPQIPVTADLAVSFREFPMIEGRLRVKYGFNVDNLGDSMISDITVRFEDLGGTPIGLYFIDIRTDWPGVKIGTATLDADEPHKATWHIPYLRPGQRATVSLYPLRSERPLADDDPFVIVQYTASASVSGRLLNHTKLVSYPVLLYWDTRTAHPLPLYSVSAAVDNAIPTPGDTVDFTVTSYSHIIPGDFDDEPGTYDGSMTDARVKVDLSPGLEYQSHQITRPGWTQHATDYDPPLSASSYDPDRGIWEIGDYYWAPGRNAPPPYVLTLTARVGSGVSLGEQCLTAAMTAFPAEAVSQRLFYPNDNTARRCLGEPPPWPVLLQLGPNTVWSIHPCVNKTAYPCTPGVNNLVIAVTGEANDSGISEVVYPRLAASSHRLPAWSPNPWPLLRPEQVIVHIPDPLARTIDTHADSVSPGVTTVAWKTAEGWALEGELQRGISSRLGTGTRYGSQIAIGESPFNPEVADWNDYIATLTVRSPDGGPPPGLVKVRSNTDGNIIYDPAPPSYTHVDTAFNISSATSAYAFFIEFEKLGTYVIEFTAAATRANPSDTPCNGSNTCTGSGASTYHVGPVSELSVRDAGSSADSAPAGKTAFHIMAVNHGPDAIAAGVDAAAGRGVRVRVSLPAGASGCAADDPRYNPSTGVWNLGAMPIASGRPQQGLPSGEILSIICDGAALAGQTATAVISNTAPYLVTIDDVEHEGTYLDYDPSNNRAAIRGVHGRQSLTLTAPAAEALDAGRAPYRISLPSQPEGVVSVTISSDNPDVSVTPATLYFTPDNWDTPQEPTVILAYRTQPGPVTLTHALGAVWKGFPPATQTFYVGGADAQLGSLTLHAGDREVGLTPAFTGSRYEYEGYVDAYTSSVRLRLSAAYANALVSVNGDPARAGARDLRIGLAEGANQIVIVVTPVVGVLPPNTYTLNIRRQALPRLSFDPPRLTIEEGGSATYTVDLDTRWLGAEVTVAITTDHPSLTVTPDEVTYSPTDWDPRTVTVTAAADAAAADETARITHRASGGHFDGVTANLPVTITDTTAPPSEPTPAPTPTPDPTAPTPTPDPTAPTPTPDPSAPTPTPDPSAPTPTPDPSAPTPTPDPSAPTPTPDPSAPTPTPDPSAPTPTPDPSATPTPTPDPSATPTPEPTPSAPPTPPSNLTAEPGDDPGALILRWTPGGTAERHWIAGIKQSDWDANNFNNLIWELAQTNAMHTLTGLDSGAEYVFAVTAGHGPPESTRWSAWTPLARGTPN